MLKLLDTLPLAHISRLVPGVPAWLAPIKEAGVSCKWCLVGKSTADVTVVMPQAHAKVDMS